MTHFTQAMVSIYNNSKKLGYILLLLVAFSPNVSTRSASGTPLSQQISDAQGSNFLRGFSTYNTVSDDMNKWYERIGATIRAYGLDCIDDPSLSIKEDQFNNIFDDPSLKLIYKGKHTSLIIIDRLYETHCSLYASMKLRKSKRILQICAKLCKNDLSEKSKFFEAPINARLSIVEKDIEFVDYILKGVNRVTGGYFENYLISKDKES